MIRLQNISVAIKGKTLLHPLDLELEEGKFHVVMGPNGAGKSTLLNTMAGLLSPSQGHVALAGKAIHKLKAVEQAQSRAFLSQKIEVSLPFTAREVIEMGSFPFNQGLQSKKDLALIESVIKELQVGHLAGRDFASLSGGEQQRVQLARVAVQMGQEVRGKVLFMDEPTNNLDIQYQYLCLEMAESFVERGATVVAVLHDFSLAAQFADQLLLLHRGRLEAAGKPVEVLQAEQLERLYGVKFEVRHNEDGLRVLPLRRRTKEDKRKPNTSKSINHHSPVNQ